jgi:hypothetical protein
MRIISLPRRRNSYGTVSIDTRKPCLSNEATIRSASGDSVVPKANSGTIRTSLATRHIADRIVPDKLAVLARLYTDVNIDSGQLEIDVVFSSRGHHKTVALVKPKCTIQSERMQPKR